MIISVHKEQEEYGITDREEINRSIEKKIASEITKEDGIARIYEAAWDRELDADPVGREILADVDRRFAEKARREMAPGEPERVAKGVEDRISVLKPPSLEGPKRQRKFLKTIEIFK